MLCRDSLLGPCSFVDRTIDRIGRQSENKCDTKLLSFSSMDFHGTDSTPFKFNFGSEPGSSSGNQVECEILRDVQHPFLRSNFRLNIRMHVFDVGQRNYSCPSFAS